MGRSRFFFSGSNVEGGRFDLLIATCGYESRCTAIAKEQSPLVDNLIAYSYPERHELAYPANLEYFSGVGKVKHPLDAASFARTLASDIGELLIDVPQPRIAVDISSFNRDRLGAIIRVIGELAEHRDLDIVFFYAFATFDSHSETLDSTVLVNGPLEGFEGWTSNPAVPVACVVGLGFENLIALAALETLEPARTVAFIARSDDARFHERVRRDNAALISSDEVALVSYDMDEPFDALHGLEGVVHALQSDYRVVLVPLGPKLFALIALLVAWEYRDSLSVWRVSADQGGAIDDRVATGGSVALAVRATASAADHDHRPHHRMTSEAVRINSTPSD